MSLKTKRTTQNSKVLLHGDIDKMKTDIQTSSYVMWLEFFLSARELWD